VKLSFTNAMSPQEEALRANRSSPDLSHDVVVVEGDTLPLLCYRIYRDSSYYPEVAQVNGLSNFRRLKPGMRLFFPPLA
jgi:nucleoid-associated protein YgaU